MGDERPVNRAGVVTTAHSFGRVQRFRALRGISVEEVLMPRGMTIAEHGHEDAQICCVLEGEYLERAAGRTWRLQPGATWFRPAREQHSNRVAQDQDALTLLVSFERERLVRCARPDAAPGLLSSLLLDEFRSALIGEFQRGDGGAALALEGWALLLLSQTERACGGGAGAGAAPQWLHDARRLIETSYSGPISLATVAASAGVHPATLAAAFRRYCHVSVGELIRELRLRRARKDLLGSRAPIKQIAAEAGFYDQAHLGRCFKRRFGVSPGEIRRR